MMKLMRSGLLGGILLLAGASGVYAQTREVFAPFVSRLDAAVTGSSVVLTWRPSTDLEGTTLIFRHTTEIDESSFADAVLVGRQPSSTERFTDVPPDTSPYYYGVLMEDADGTRYELFIAFRNKTTQAVQVERPPTLEERTASVQGLTTAAEGDAVVLTFTASRRGRDLLVFRHSEPIASPADLISAQAPLTISSDEDSFRDFPVPGQSYYYAVIDAELFKLGRTAMVKGENTTADAVEISLPVVDQTVATGSRRLLPLPFLLITQAVSSAAALPGIPLQFPEKQLIGPQTSKAIADLLAAIGDSAESDPELRILPEDTSLSAGGSSFGLQSIAVDQLSAAEFEAAELSLKRFLRIRRSSAVEARSRFYLAQSYYYQDRYQESIMELLLAQDEYPSAVQPWLDAALRRLRGAT